MHAYRKLKKLTVEKIDKKLIIGFILFCVLFFEKMNVITSNFT